MNLNYFRLSMLALGILVMGNTAVHDVNLINYYPKPFSAERSSKTWNWKDIALAQPGETKLYGHEGEMLNKGLARIALSPYETQWVLSDVSFALKRIFTNYSGDISGRYIELAALTSPTGQMSPNNFGEILKHITDYQKPDGHFGIDIDLTKRITKEDPPMPMFWGNARLLVGLVTAAKIYHDERLMASARKLGDYYIKSVELLCTPERIEEFLATGGYGGSLTCCYFPAIESLAMLHLATGDKRYLKAACDIAEYFRHFDKLPTDHSHGSISAYRGILMLYQITNDSDYLRRAEAKWEKAVSEGFVWPTGGIGEHWQVFFGGDEACSESDWLRFNLGLWQLTGRPRYLEMAERLLANHYPADQCENGGFGQRTFGGEDGVGPSAMKGVHELYFCCTFHGPLGLHFLKAYLATGGKKTIFVNFPLNFSAPVQAGGARWLVSANTTKDSVRMEWQTHVIAEPQKASQPVTILMRIPNWAGKVTVNGVRSSVNIQRENGYIKLATNCTKKTEFKVTMQGTLALEQRRFKPLQPTAGKLTVIRDVTLLAGPEILMARSTSKSRLTLLATMDKAGRLDMLRDTEGHLVSPILSGPEASEAEVHEALMKGQVISLRPHAWSFWNKINTRRRVMIAHDIMIVPADHLTVKERSRFAQRAADVVDPQNSAFYGERLEKRSEIWADPGSGWSYKSSGILALWGDIGLLNGVGYKDYRFEFDLMLPKEGQGITNWVVRAQNESDYVMFQIQCNDMNYSANEWKTEPNTLRSYVRRGGEWTAVETVKLKKNILKDRSYKVATECHGEQVTVWIDGEKVYRGNYAGHREGTVGLRAGRAVEQGLFNNISLKKIE
jgi:hypothetical protein